MWERKMATWKEVQQNPTLYPLALLPGKGEELRWHGDAHLPHSSQVFCVSAFGMLQQLAVRDRIIRQFLGLSERTPIDEDSAWMIQLEEERPELLSECGQGQVSSIDVLLQNRSAVFAVEAKFLSDALSGFGGCSQPKKQCAGFYGPGSDLKTGTNAWCRLEVWDGNRSPRNYWAMGRAFFRESVFTKQSHGEECPLGGSNYQLMRNFLFAAALAQKQRIASFGMVAVAPAKTAGRLQRQIDTFRKDILQPQFEASVQLVFYERLIDLLQQSGDAAASALATFLAGRIAALIS
jgi:hypothetical protein